MSELPHIIEGRRFDEPLVIQGKIETEPERYIAEKPYELTKFEFSIMRKSIRSEFWFNLAAGATVGIVLSVAGKALAALIEKKPSALESWEMWAVGAGAAASLALRCIPNKEDKERAKLEEVIDGHFTENRPRRLHLTSNQEAK